MPRAALRNIESERTTTPPPTGVDATRSLTGTRRTSVGQLSAALGWIGVGIGLAEILMPRTIAQTAGLPIQPRLMRVLGTRELVTSAGILLQSQQTGWRWSRVAGDVLDLSLLAWMGRRHQHRRLSLLTALLAGMTALDMLAAYDKRRQRVAQRLTSGDLRMHKSLYIQRPADECYRFWRNFENFPYFMQHVEAVQVVDATHTHWRVRTPLGQPIEWTAELFSDIPARQLGWRTIAGSAIEHTGVVRFVPTTAGNSTRLDIDMRYHAPSSKAGVMLAKILGEEPSQQIDDDLRRSKQLIETGEIATTVGQPSGRRGALVRLLRRGESS